MKRITNGEVTLDLHEAVVTIFIRPEPTFHLVVPSRLLRKSDGHEWKGEIVVGAMIKSNPRRLPISVFIWYEALGLAFGGQVEVEYYDKGLALGRIDSDWLKRLRLIGQGKERGACICVNTQLPPVSYIKLPRIFFWLARIINRRRQNVIVKFFRCQRVIHRNVSPVAPVGWDEVVISATDAKVATSRQN